MIVTALCAAFLTSFAFRFCTCDFCFYNELNRLLYCLSCNDDNDNKDCFSFSNGTSDNNNVVIGDNEESFPGFIEEGMGFVIANLLNFLLPPPGRRRVIALVCL